MISKRDIVILVMLAIATAAVLYLWVLYDASHLELIRPLPGNLFNNNLHLGA